MKWIETHADRLIDLIRIYLGIGLFIKAIYFMTHTEEAVRMVAQAGDLWFAPAAMIHYVILAHLMGGLFLALGLLTRIAAAVQLPILLYAVFYLHLPKMLAIGPRQNLEFSALVLFLLSMIFLYGSGRWSFDYYIFKRGSAETA